MKKPTVGETDKLRALTNDPELRALMEQYYAAPPSTREPILEAFNKKADALYPGWRETMERSRLDGVYLRAQVIGYVKRVRARDDLSEFERFTAKDAEVEFILILEKALKQGFLTKEDAFMLAESTQFLMAVAVLEPEKKESLRRQALIDMARKGGTTRKKEKPWASYARMLALKIPEKDRARSNSKIAGMLWDFWALEKPAEWTGKKPLRPSFETLADFVGKLRVDGTFPPQAARSRRPRL